MPKNGKLTPQEKFAAHLLASGLSVKQVLDETSIPTSALKKLLNLPLFQQEIAQKQSILFQNTTEKLVTRLEQAQLPALEKMILLTDADAEGIQYNSSKWLLEAGPLGIKKAKEGEQAGNTFVIGTVEINAIVQGALRSGNTPTLSVLQRMAQEQPCQPQPPLNDASPSLEVTLEPA